MGLAAFLKVVRRRWYVLLLGLLLTVAVASGAAITTPPSYTARGLVLVLPSREVLKKSPNPLLDLDGLVLPTQVLVSYYASANVQAQLKKAAPTADVTVSLDDSTGGPIIAVDVSDPTSAGTIKTLNYVVGSIAPDLARIQAQMGAPPGSTLSSTPLVVDKTAQSDRKSQVRVTVAAAVAGLAVTAFLIFAVDGIALRRRSGTDRAPVRRGGAHRVTTDPSDDHDRDLAQRSGFLSAVSSDAVERHGPTSASRSRMDPRESADEPASSAEGSGVPAWPASRR